MMSKSSKSKLKDIFLLWAITNVHFCVKGHPMFVVDDMARVTGQAEGAGAATHIENVNDASKVATGFSHESSNGRKLGTSAAASLPGTSSGDVKTVETMGKGHLDGINALREPTKNLGSDGTSLAGKFDDSKSTSQVTEGVKASEGNPTPKEVSTELSGTKGIPVTESFHAEGGQGLKTAVQDAEQLKSPRQILEQVTLKYKNMEPNLLKDISKGQQTTRLSAAGAPDLPPIFDKGLGKTLKKDFKYLKPAEVQELSPVDLLRYLSERDASVGRNSQNLDGLARKYYALEADLFWEAAGRDASRISEEIRNLVDPLVSKGKSSNKDLQMSSQNLGMSIRRDFIEQVAASKLGTEHFQKTFNKLQDAKATYDRVFDIAHADARKLISTESLSPEALKKFTDKEYMSKAALFDQKVARNYDNWLSFEGEVRKATDTLFLRYKNIQGEPAFNAKMDSIIKGLESQGGRTTGTDIIQQANRQFIKEAKALKDPKISNLAFEIWVKGKAAQISRNNALRGADGVFKRNNLLDSTALRYKHTGWSFKKFMKKISNWIFGRLRKGKQNKEASTATKPLPSDGPVPKTSSEAAPNVEVSAVNTGKHTPEVEVGKQPAVEATSSKDANSPGKVDLKEEAKPLGLRRIFPSSWTNKASSAENPNPSQGYWKSWFWPGKRVQPVGDKAQASQDTASSSRWWPPFRSNAVPSDPQKAPLLETNPTIS
ncbi:secreted protein [Melampsora americana]|nr:secreted protein [Melampsora americana]